MPTRHKPFSVHEHLDVRRIRVGQRVILAEGIRRVVFQDLFHYFMTITWPQLFATASQPNDAVMAILQGFGPHGTWGAMGSFAHLSNQQIADLVNYIRTAWSNHAEPNAVDGPLVIGAHSQIFPRKSDNPI